MPQLSENYRFPALEKFYRLIPEGLALSFILWLTGIEIVIEGDVATDGPLIAAVTEHDSHLNNPTVGLALLRKGRRRVYVVAKKDYWNKPGNRDILDVTFPAGSYFTRSEEEKASNVPSTFYSELYKNVTTPHSGIIDRIQYRISKIFNGEARLKPSRHTLMIYPKGSRDETAENQMGIFHSAARLYMGDDKHPGINVPIKPISFSNMLVDPETLIPVLHEGKMTKKEIVSLVKSGIGRSIRGKRHKILVKIHPAIEPNEVAKKEGETTARLALALMVEFEKYC